MFGSEANATCAQRILQTTVLADEAGKWVETHMTDAKQWEAPTAKDDTLEEWNLPWGKFPIQDTIVAQIDARVGALWFSGLEGVCRIGWCTRKCREKLAVSHVCEGPGWNDRRFFCLRADEVLSSCAGDGWRLEGDRRREWNDQGRE